MKSRALAFCPYGKGRREAHLVRAVHDLLRHIPAHGRAQNILHRSVFELDAGGNGSREFHQFPVQERDPGFQAVGHAHAVLHLKQGRQERLEVKVRHPVQIGLLIHILRHEQPFIRVIGIIGGQGVPVDAVLHAGGTVDELEVALAGAHRTAPCSRSCGAWACSCEER